MNSKFVVANSTPLIVLQKIGQLELLKLAYSRIYIPEAVNKEIIVNGAIKYEVDDFMSANSWIIVKKIINAEAKRFFITNLHEGEVETIILAIENDADVCILDVVL